MYRAERRPVAISVAKLQRMTRTELHAMLSGDPVEAGRWVHLAALHGLAAAQVRLGRMLLEGTGVAMDKASALAWFKTAARSSDAEAMNMVGRCYENGWGAVKDLAIAAGWYRRSAEAGHDWGEYNHANMLFDGLGVDADRPQALVWYLNAARQGHSRAMNQAGRCFEEGWGVAKDGGAAAEWYRKSAEAGYFRGQYNYATTLIARNRIEEAAYWFWTAAETGTTDMRRRIARALLGRGEPILQEVGVRVLELCCEHGC